MTEEMQNQPQPTVAQAPPQQVGAPIPGASGKAIAALVLGILSLVCCGFFTGIPGIIIGKQELNAIQAGRSNKEGHTITQIGFILAIIGTSLSCLGFIFYAIAIIFGLSMSAMEGIQESVFSL